MPDAASTDIHEAYAAFDKVLLSVARTLAPDRSDATVYSQCRSLLLDSPYRKCLPGFLFQCISVSKYREFISLYDAVVSAREDFVRSALAPCRAHYEQRDTFQAVSPRPLSSREWTL